MIVKVFSKQDCPKCEEAKVFVEVARERGFEVELHDIETVEGLSEAAMYSIMATPSVVVTDKSGECLNKWKDQVPAIEAIVSR